MANLTLIRSGADTHLATLTFDFRHKIDVYPSHDDRLVYYLEKV